MCPGHYLRSSPDKHIFIMKKKKVERRRRSSPDKHMVVTSYVFGDKMLLNDI